jgi:hypothetical protein
VSVAEGLRSRLGARRAARLGALLTAGDGSSSRGESPWQEATRLASDGGR